jgi:hypothetical protein
LTQNKPGQKWDSFKPLIIKELKKQRPSFKKGVETGTKVGQTAKSHIIRVYQNTDPFSHFYSGLERTNFFFFGIDLTKRLINCYLITGIYINIFCKCGLLYPVLRVNRPTVLSLSIADDSIFNNHRSVSFTLSNTLKKNTKWDDLKLTSEIGKRAFGENDEKTLL